MEIYEVQPCTDDKQEYLTPTDWQSARLLEDFHYPWRADTPPQTEFRALHNSSRLYFRFDVEDKQLIAGEHAQMKQAVAQSDRVELFFRKDARMHPYYCLEMDWQGRLLDNSARYHRIMDYHWSWPGGLSFRSSLTAKGYKIEGALSKASLRQLELLQNDQIEAGLFRGEYQNSPRKQVKWISWVRPDTAQPDFHVPSAFGLLKFI